MKLEYNYLNLTSAARDLSGNLLATYRWLADGTKVGVADANGTGFDYVGSLIYKRNGDGLTLESAAFGDGRIMVSEGSNGNVYSPNYFITDHLGSTRAVVEADGTVSERNDYYAFGGRWEVSGAAITDNRFRFSGKEDQTTGNLPYQDFGARFLGKKLPIWTSLDPKAEIDRHITPYAYCGNNPINKIDPDGKFAFIIPAIPLIIKLGAAIVATTATVAIMEETGTNDALRDGVKDLFAKTSPEYKHQGQKDREAREGLNQAQANMQEGINNNFPELDPDGSGKGPNNPNVSLVTKVAVGIGLATTFIQQLFEGAQPDVQENRPVNTEVEVGSNGEELKEEIIKEEYYKYRPMF